MDMDSRLERIETKLDQHLQSVTRLEEKQSAAMVRLSSAESRIEKILDAIERLNIKSSVGYSILNDVQILSKRVADVDDRVTALEVSADRSEWLSRKAERVLMLAGASAAVVTHYLGWLE